MSALKYGLGNYSSPVHIVYKLDKYGRKRAYRWHANPMHYGRRFPMNVVLAEAIEAAGEALSVTWERSALRVVR